MPAVSWKDTAGISSSMPVTRENSVLSTRKTRVVKKLVAAQIFLNKADSSS